MDTSTLHDIAVIGGGVVGCAVLNKLTSQGYSCILLEKKPNLVSEASAGNSGMLHCGFDAPLGSTELNCILDSQQIVYDFLDKTGLPYQKIGGTMVAWNEEQVFKMQKTLATCRQVGFDLLELSLSELFQREPHLSRRAKSAIWIPGETIVDPWLTSIALAHQAKMKGAKVLTGTCVEACEYEFKNWRLHTNTGDVRSKLVVNCAGLYGDFVDRLAGVSKFRILPRKGQYIVYSKTAKDLIDSNILPVPTEITKGVIVFKTVYDNIVVGPTAENTNIRSAAAIDDDITEKLIKYGQSVIPGLCHHKIVSMYTGVRPATETKDYHIIPYTDRNWLTVGGIRSTGLSGCLGISNMVNGLLENKFGIEPSSAVNHNVERIEFKFTGNDIVQLDNNSYSVTHPITRTGLSSDVNISKL